MPLPKILIVDDSQTIRLSVNRLFQNAGYDTVVAVDGYDALEKITDEIGLVVLDINMPGLDGYGVAEKLRALGSQYERLPIVFLTSVESKAMELLGREFGAYVSKTSATEELLGTVEDLLAAVQNEDGSRVE